MPVYFFDIKDADGIHRDDVGLELPDMDTAILESRRTLAEMSMEAGREGQDQVTEILIRDHGEGPVRMVMSVRTERGTN